MAERVGFEPTVPLQGHLISSQAHSTTLPPLQVLVDSNARERTGFNGFRQSGSSTMRGFAFLDE